MRMSLESIRTPTILPGSSQRPPGTSNREKIYGRDRRNITVKIPTQSFLLENLQASFFACY